MTDHRHLAAAVLLATGLPMLPAHAQCTVTGTTASCSGTITDPVDLDIDGLALTNDGTIDVGSDDAVRLRGDDNSVTNSSTIRATGSGDEAVQADGANFSLTNSGLIESRDDKGVQAEEFGTTVVNSGRILSGDEAIEAGDGVAITNSGEITGAEDAVQYGDGTLVNSGTITGGSSGDGDGIDIDSGTVTNTGTITSLGAGSAGIDVDEETVDGDPVTKLLTIENRGTIQGELGILVEPLGPDETGLNESAQLVRNFDTLIGAGGTAAALAAGDDRFEAHAGSVIEGTVDLGPGADTLFVGAGIGMLADAFFDGGDGVDVLALGADVGLGDLTILQTASLTFSYDEEGLSSSFTVDGFERLRLADGSRFTLNPDGTVAPIPLPAGLPLLAAAAGALALLRRRR